MAKFEISNYEGREQAFVKHYLLDQYLPQLTYKIARSWDALVFVDGFAGPWETKDPNLADSSFGVAIETLRSCQFGLSRAGTPISMAAVLVERDRETYPQLQSYASAAANPPGLIVKAINDTFVNAIPEINRIVRAAGTNPFKFVLLDPKGWADIPMHRLRTFLNSRSCEVIVTLMTSFMLRFVDEEDRRDSYINLFGRAEVLEMLRGIPRREQVDLAVTEYGHSLQRLCGFRYVASAAILEPTAQSIKYFLVYGTKHPKGVEVFKQAELKAARIQEELRHQKEIEKTRQPGFQFEDETPISSFTLRLHKRYCERARSRVIECLKRAATSTVSYESLFCEAMSFPLVRPEDLMEWLENLVPAIEIHISKGHRVLSPSNPDFILIRDPSELR